MKVNLAQSIVVLVLPHSLPLAFTRWLRLTLKRLLLLVLLHPAF